MSVTRTTRLGAAQAQNQQDYDAALAAIAAEYREELRVAENGWRLAALDAYADEETSLTTALLARKSGLANDYGTYLTALSVAATQYSDRVNLNDQVYSYHRERIDHFNATVALSGIFTNPTFDYEVCFVAGTPVLMADGSRRAIETLRPGDLVLAADQLNPESAPAPAKVVRFFDNGEKTVVRLRFEGQDLVCTPEHPFYVLGKGWVRADGLVEGDLCLSAKGESVAFVSREEIAETRRVYNIEVEGAHTYFVGDDDGVLAHNICGTICSRCGGSGKIQVHEIGMIGPLYPTVTIDCTCPCHFDTKFKESNSLGKQMRNQYFIPFDTGTKEFTDTGIIRKVSESSRKNYLITWAHRNCAQADDVPREYTIDDWTSIFINGKVISKAGLNFDDGSPKPINSGFWLGTIYDFQGKGR